MRWHCYIDYREAVYHSTVNAGSADQAAELAAQEHGISGLWTVLAIDETRGVCRVKIGSHEVFEAISTKSGPA